MIYWLSYSTVLAFDGTINSKNLLSTQGTSIAEVSYNTLVWTFRITLVQFSSRWHLCVRKSPFLCPSSRLSCYISPTWPLKQFQCSSVSVTTALSRPLREDRLALPLSTPVSSYVNLSRCGRSSLWGSAGSAGCCSTVYRMYNPVTAGCLPWPRGWGRQTVYTYLHL